MRSIPVVPPIAFFAVLALLSGCSSDDESGNDVTTGGSPGTGGATGGDGTGAQASGGLASGGSPAGGTTSGGAPAGGAESGGAGGTEAGGTGGVETGGTGGVVDPPVTVHHVCPDIPEVGAGGSESFMIVSPDFPFCGSLPTESTCDGNPFGYGASPELTWTVGPQETQSYAIVFVDLSILEDDDPALKRLAYHWVMWDIPASVTGLPAGFMNGHLPDMPAEIAGARQWGVRNDYGYLGPCPNPFPADHENFGGSLVLDSYSFTLYALDTATLVDLPEPPEDHTNWAVVMGEYLDTIALDITEYRGVSAAWSSEFMPGAEVMPPCTMAQVDGAMTDMCLTGPE